MSIDDSDNYHCYINLRKTHIRTTKYGLSRNWQIKYDKTQLVRRCHHGEQLNMVYQGIGEENMIKHIGAVDAATIKKIKPLPLLSEADSASRWTLSC